MEDYSDFVRHPRYGRAPRITGLDPAEDFAGPNHFLWHSPAGTRVPGTAVVAQVLRQAPATIPATHYFDTRRTCRQCGSPFLFFADEQKYWYESLKFPLHVDCLDCWRCRRRVRQLRETRRLYEELASMPERPAAQTVAMVEAGILLVEATVFPLTLLPKLLGLARPVLHHREPSLRDAAAKAIERMKISH